jgi:UDPglucose 6-dehydrogenase
MYDLAQSANSDYNKVLSLWQLIENKQTYLDVGDNLRGFGGKCLPKDLDFLIDTMSERNIEETLFTAVKQDNNKWPTTTKS